MSSLRHTATLSATVRLLLADRRKATATRVRTRPQAGSGRRRVPSAGTLRDELASFRRAQSAPYWHHDHRAG